MSLFADSFWSPDLYTGFSTLFKKLHEGLNQNDLFIQLFASRMQSEVEYGRHLCQIINGIDKFHAQSSNMDESLDKMISQMTQEGNHHLSIAANIETTVLGPFTKWCEEHKQRIEYSENILKTNIGNFDKSKKYMDKLEQAYFNKCRNLEDFKKECFNEDELADAMKSLELQRAHDISLAKEREFQKFGTVGCIDFDYKTMRETLGLLLTKLDKHDYKVPLINYTLYNVNTGREIVMFLMNNMNLKDLDQAETFGQDLVNQGFLKYCNGVGTTFVNSKKFQYQWKSYAYKFSRIPQPNAGVGEDDENDGNGFTNYIQDFTSKIKPESNDSNNGLNISENEKSLFKLMKDMESIDAKYRKECLKFDDLRCSIEELIIDHYSFMEKCELDRLKALKKVTFDFCASISNKITSMKITVEKLMEIESQMTPEADLSKMIETNRTGFFQPCVIPYNNYYNPGEFQNFGIDLDTRCRLDKKIVPLLVSAILSYMDRIYPELANDNERTTIWMIPVKLHSTHKLRRMLNRQSFQNENEIFKILNESEAELSTIASVLKVYLLELPKPLISDDISDILKALYTEFPPHLSIKDSESDTQKGIDSYRIQGIINTLKMLSKPHIATLDAITTHFYRLIKILKMSDSEASKALADQLVISMSQEFANCIIKVKLVDGNDLGFKIFHDLLVFKKQIFCDLKRQGSKNSKSVDPNTF